MAHALSITDGVDTISLSTTDVYLTRYVPVAPTVRANTVRGRDGDDVGDLAYENVTETIELLPYAASTAQLQEVVNEIERMMDYAFRRQRRRYSDTGRVYLQLQVSGEASAYRSEILHARFEPTDESLSVWGNLQFQARLHITRRYFWEGAETELQLSTSNQSAATGGRTIYNHDDSGTGHDNWVQIASTQVIGALPAPVKVTLNNNTGSAQGYRNIHMATNVYNDPANFAHVIEGEDVVSGYGTPTANAGCSGGNYVSKTWSGSTTMHWDITAAQAQDVQGRDVRFLMRLAGTPTATIYCTANIYDKDGLILLAAGDEVRLNTTTNSIVDLGVLPVPPGGASTAFGACRLVLTLRSSTSTTIEIDFFQMFATESYRHLYQRGYNAANGGIIIDNGIDGYTVLQESSVDYPIYTVYDDPLKVFPGKLQKIVFLHDEGTSAAIDNTFSVRVYYRPRRFTI